MRPYKWLLILVLLSAVVMLSCAETAAPAAYFQEYESEEFRTSLAAGAASPADVIYMDAVWAPDYINRGWLQPIPRDAIQDLEDMYPTLPRYFEREGELYAVPHTVQTVALAVNAALVEKAGVSADDLRQQAAAGEFTWPDLQEIAAAVTELDPEVYGLGLIPGFSNYLPFLFQAGGTLYDESRTRLALYDPQSEVVSGPALEALAFYGDLYRSGWVYPGYNPEINTRWATGEWPYWGMYDQMLDLFAGDQIGMLLVGPGQYDALRARLPAAERDKVQVIELAAYAPGRQATIGLVRGFSLFSPMGKAPKPEAVEFIRFASSQEGMRFWIGNGETPPDYVPARRSLRDEWLDVHPDTAPFVNGIAYMDSFQPAQASVNAIAIFDREAALVMARTLAGEIGFEQALIEWQGLGEELAEQ